MNRIQMYASSSHLKHGLQRVIAVSHTLTEPVLPGVSTSWWTSLPAELQEGARTHSLPLDALARVYALDSTRQGLDAARARLGLSALDHSTVAKAFRVAIISGKAHRAHMGRDVYGSSNKGLWDLVCADFGEAVAGFFGLSLGDDPVSTASSTLAPEAEELLRTLVAFDTSPQGPDHDACVAWLRACLEALGLPVPR